VTLEKSRSKALTSKFTSKELKSKKGSEDYLTFSSARSRMDALYDFVAITALDEVVVTEKKIEQGGSPSIYGQTPDATIYTADNIAFQTVLQLVGLFAGVTVNGNTVSIRQRGTPLWVLDGIPVYNNNPESNNVALQAETPGDASPVEASFEETLRPGPAPTFITNLDTFSVERVELLKGPRAAIYGSRGANGVILIYTKRGVGQTRAPVLSPDFTILGHGAEKEFYVPKYDVKKDAHATPDYRATLYWNPSLTTDENGNATIEFFNSDTAKQIQLSIEGISSNGILGTHLETLGEGD
jgi:TonB-dependent SusC/RagA subfamily outer membrane receptor